MFKAIILSIILSAVAVGCSPAATIQPTDIPDKGTPELHEPVRAKVSTHQNTATAPSQTRRALTPTPEEGEPTANSDPNALSDPDTSYANHVLSFIPASWLDKGIWISHEGKAIQSAGAPDPKTLEEFLNLSDKEQTSFFDAFAKAFPTEFVVTMRQSLREWKEEFGLDLFSLESTASVGTTSRFPLMPAVLLGEISESEITGKLLNSGYESRIYKGKEYYEIRKNLRASLSDSPIGLNRTNRVFTDKEVVIASPEATSVEEFLDVFVGDAKSLSYNRLALTAIESLGETFATVILARNGVFNPVGSVPLTYAKPSDWGTLDHWNLLAAGSGQENGHPFFALTIAFDDPTAADSNLDEVKVRLANYQTLVPQRFPESTALIQGWPDLPLEETCHDTSINATSSTHGSTITIVCKTNIPLFWTQMVDLRDLGFLIP